MSFVGVVGFLLCSLMHCVIMSMYSYTVVKSIKARFILKQTSEKTNIKTHTNLRVIEIISSRFLRIKCRRTKRLDQMRKWPWKFFETCKAVSSASVSLSAC